MIEIRKANETNCEVLALLGTITYTESHGHFIEDKNDLISYNNDAFSVSRMKEELNDSNNLIYIIYTNDLPIGYAKLVLNESLESTVSQNSCRLERLYILKDFIPLKVGYQFLTFLENKAKDLHFDTIRLSVYIKNSRAIKFYQRNGFKKVGVTTFVVNGKEYDNFIFLKTNLASEKAL